MTFKKVKVVMLPTNEKATIALSSNKLSLKTKAIQEESQHLYFLSDEEIKEGDWFIHNQVVSQCLKGEKWTGEKKIIATTDKYLGADYNGAFGGLGKLPQPSQSFVEKFVDEYNEGNKITEVMVEYENYYASGALQPNLWQLKINPKDNTITIRKVKESWNRSELPIEILQNMLRYCESQQIYDKLGNYGDFYYKGKKWIEENL